MLKKKLSVKTYLSVLAFVIGIAAVSTFIYARGGFNNLARAADEITIVSYGITSSSDIMNQDGQQTSTGNQGAWYGTGKNRSQSFLGMRFSGGLIPPGAEIVSAKVSFIPPQTHWITVSTEMFVEDNPATESFSRSNTPSRRTLLPSSIKRNDNVSWTKDQSYSYDVTQIIGDYYKKYKNINGQISMIIQGKGTGSYGRKSIYGDASRGKTPTLLIEYRLLSQPTNPASVTNTPIPATPTKTAATPTAMPTQTQPQTPTPTHDPGHSDETSAPGTLSHAMGLWNPNPKYDTCTKAEHDSYKVQGPDGKWYPTWHPPVHTRSNGSTCTFGHEHGRDPSQSVLYSFLKETYGYDADKNGKVEGAELATAGVPFGYVNEQLDIYNTAKGITNGMRHEDHVGHKIEWENNIQRDWSVVNGGSSRTPSGIYCDFFMKMHQGTHSKDAFTNNMHELIQAYKCTDGIQMANAQMLVFGKPGGFSDGNVAGGNQFVQVGPYTPANAPGTSTGLSRSIPTIGKVVTHILVPSTQWSQFSEGLYEDWISGNYVRTPNGNRIAYFDPHFAVFGPSRFYWPGTDPNTYGITRTAQDKADNVGRSVDTCFMKESNGERPRGGECENVTNYGQITTQIPYDDPRSPFNGVKREFYFNNLDVSDVGSNRVWYSDIFGNNAVTTPFVGSVKHYLKPKNTTAQYPYPFESNAIGGNRYYGGQGVHAPN